ncbi:MULTISPECIES: hypothetical protein [Holdemanella]|jgi:hypothetical protein|uniref:hypothetical protein n=1 Tax=Holdemanella TaxID=1573535 RepID=UPI000E4E0C2D|nr:MULTISPECIES: hypothetical protein [Holdemanella]MBD9044979.1 hypothetical protein [Solobacterium sp.]MCQ4804068.1 hypothetical protein [Holdemanella sp. MSK.7.32]RGJ48028.1 hypothetical protein DXD61_04050 [Eubacterium sp. TM06-47]
MKKIMIMLVLIASMNIVTPVLANETEVTANIDVTMPYKDQLVWKYKFINGKLYRRLWNQTLNKWVGDHWIPC